MGLGPGLPAAPSISFALHPSARSRLWPLRSMLSQSSRAFGAKAGSARPEPDDLGEGIVDHPGGDVIGEKMGAILVFLLAPSKMVERKKTEKMLARMEGLDVETISARTMPR